jgi:hypothetical protein
MIPQRRDNRPGQTNFPDSDGESDRSDENTAQGRRTQTRARQADMDEDTILEEARRIRARRAARARRRHDPSSQPSLQPQSSHTSRDIDPTRYAQPPFLDYPPYANPYLRANPDHIRSTNPYNQSAPPHFPPPGNSDPFRSSNPYSQPAPPSRGNTYPYNLPANSPYSHGSLDPHQPNSNPYDQPTHHYQSNPGQFPPSNLSNAHLDPTTRNPRSSFTPQVTHQRAPDPTPQVCLRLPTLAILIVYVVAIVARGTSTLIDSHFIPGGLTAHECITTWC